MAAPVFAFHGHAWGRQELRGQFQLWGTSVLPQAFPKGKPSRENKRAHIWIFCGLNAFIPLLITRWVILTGSVL